MVAFWIKAAYAHRSAPTWKSVLSWIKMNSLVFFVLFFSSIQAFSFGTDRNHQWNELCQQRCQRASNPWTVKSLRMHLSEKLRVHPSEITIPGAASIIDIGTCSGFCKNGGQCHVNKRTAIVFDVNGQQLVNEDYFVVDSCSCSSDIHKTFDCPVN